MNAFWEACTVQGVVSKPLTLHRVPHAASPVGLCAGEAIKHGAPVINVPYSAVLNGQTLRGDRLPPALPPLRKAVRFLTRRGRLGTVTAHSLWLASFLACHLEARASAAAAATSLDPLLSDGAYPPLPNLFTPANAASCVSLRELSATALRAAEDRVGEEVDLTHVMLRHYTKRRGVMPRLCPGRDALVLSYRTVMQRALLLPWNCEPSAPGDLAELIESSPELSLLPSLVPVIDMVRAAPATAARSAEQTSDEEGGAQASADGGNCALLTCVQSDFVSSSSRRRVIVETTPLAARRVVVCATRPIKEGEELLMDFE